MLQGDYYGAALQPQAGYWVDLIFPLSIDVLMNWLWPVGKSVLMAQSVDHNMPMVPSCASGRGLFESSWLVGYLQVF